MNIRNSLSALLLLLFWVFCFSTQGQTKKALLVGISDYPSVGEGSWNKIHGGNDVALLTPILKKQGFKVTSITNARATYNAITEALKKLSNTVQSGDLVYIHFSGHGQAVEDINGDENDGWDEAFVPYDAQRAYLKGKYEGEKHLLDDELNDFVSLIRTRAGKGGMVYVIVDACHAGSLYRGDEEDSIFVRGAEVGFSKNGKVFVPKIDKSGNIKIISNKNLAPIKMLEACRSYEVNTEIKQNGKYYGALSYYIYKELLTQTLSFDTDWIETVRNNMDKDIRLVRQHMVTESSD